MSVMTAILIGPLSAARAGGALNEELSSARASAAGRARETRIGPTSWAGRVTRVRRTLRIAVGVPPSYRTNRRFRGTNSVMARPIEDYALIGDTRTAALVCRDGSIDWLCLPHFDSGACFAKLVGDEGNGAWTLAPKAADARVVERRYREDSLMLETIWELDGGARVRVVDGMLPASDVPRVVRHVVGVQGRVAMRTCATIRYDYGQVVPWLRRASGTLISCAGPDAVALYGDVPFECDQHSSVAEFEVREGERVSFELVYYPSYEQQPGPSDVFSAQIGR